MIIVYGALVVYRGE